MTETQREPVPQNDESELDTALAFLTFARESLLRDAIADSDAAIAAAGDPEARTVMPIHGELRTLRWVLAHMVSETVRHAGHADILREQIDGTTGR